MSTRYLSNLTLAIVGGFLVVASQAFAAPTFSSLVLAGGIVAVVLGAVGVPLRSRGGAQRGIDATIAVLGTWTIVASAVYAGATITWLGFASGAALVALAVIGLTLHELSSERVVHSFEVSPSAQASPSAQESPLVGVR
jgi:hypothetical protein